MAAVTLDTIRSAADAKYGSYDIDLGGGNVTRMLNPLRLSDEKRAELKEAQAALKDSGDDADQIDLFQRVIRAVTETDGQASRLFEAVGRDLAVYAEIFSGYGESTQVGEA